MMRCRLFRAKALGKFGYFLGAVEFTVAFGRNFGGHYGNGGGFADLLYRYG